MTPRSGKDTISGITDRVVEEMQAWTSRPLERVYAAVVVDAINVKVRDGQVANRPVYAAIGVDLEGHKDILGMWFGDGGGESAKFWMVVLSELRNRGVADVFFLVCDGLKGLPDSVNAVWPATIVQTCLIHLIRNSFRFASRKCWDELSRDLKPIYTDLHRRQRRGRRRCPRRPARQVGRPLSSDHPALAQRMGRVHPVPGLRRGDPQDLMQHQRDRKPERPLPARGQGPRTLPQRAGRHEMPVSSQPIPGPQRHRSDTMGNTVEASPERLHNHLRRPDADEDKLIMKPPLTPLIGQTPCTCVPDEERVRGWRLGIGVRGEGVSAKYAIASYSGSRLAWPTMGHVDLSGVGYHLPDGR